MFFTTRRTKVDTCWTDLAERMTATGEFDMERLTPELLANTYLAGRAVIRGSESNTDGIQARIHAYLALLETDAPDWLEVALAYVDAEYAGNGVGNELMAELLTKAHGFRLFTISRNPAYWAVLRGYEYWAVSRATLRYDIETWAEKVGLTGPGKRNRLPETALRQGLPRLNPGTRTLFVR